VLLDAGAPRAQGAAVRATAADGAWVELSTSGAVVMTAPESGAPGGAGPRGAAWRVVLPTGALAAAAPDACMTVLHADGCASVRLPRGWAHADRAWAHNDNARARAAPPPPPAAALSAADAALIIGWAAAAVRGAPWPAPAADDPNPDPGGNEDSAPAADGERLCAAVWVRTNCAGQRWAELDAAGPSAPAPPPLPPAAEPAHSPPLAARAAAPAAAVQPKEAAGGAARAAAAGRPASSGAGKAAAGAPPRRSAAQAAPNAPAAAAQPPRPPPPPPPPPAWLPLAPVPVAGALDGDAGTAVAARADGVLTLAYPSGDRLLQDAAGARLRAGRDGWLAEADGCPDVAGR